MTNPISAKVRGWFYVAAAIIGSLSASVSACLLVLGVDVRWQAVVAIFLGGTMSTLGMLARTNLTLDVLHPTVDAVPMNTTIISTPAVDSTSTTEATPATGGA